MKRFSKNWIVVIILFCSIAGCSDGIFGIWDNKPSIDYAEMSIEPDTIRTFAGAKFQLDYSASIKPTGIYNDIRFTIVPEDFATIIEFGKTTVNGLGKGMIIANLYSPDDEIIASDTLHIYSEAINTLKSTNGLARYTSYLSEYGISLLLHKDRTLYQSFDMGLSWNETYIPYPDFYFDLISRSNVDPNMLILSGYKTYNTELFNSRELFLSTDNGRTWSMLPHPFKRNSTEEFRKFVSVVFSPESLSTIYVTLTTNKFEREVKLFKSDDLGQNWELIKSIEYSSPNPPQLHIDQSYDFYLLNGYLNGKGLISKDKGESWLYFDINDINAIFHLDHNGRIYAKTNRESSAPEKLVYSDDQGSTWSVLFEADQYYYQGVDTFGPQNIAVLIGKNNNRERIIRYSLDGGLSWKDYTIWYNTYGTSFKPVRIEILGVNDETISILSTSNEFGSKSEVWRLDIYHNL